MMPPHDGSQLHLAAFAAEAPAPPSLDEDFALRLALGAPFPRDFREAFEVSREDFADDRAGRGSGTALSLRGEAPPLERGSAYVQDPRDMSRFKTEPVGRVRRELKASRGLDGTRGRGSSLPCCSAMIAAVVDPDAAQLSLSDASDIGLLELGALAEKSRAMVCTVFFTAQGLLAGLSIFALLLVMSVDPGGVGASVGNATTSTTTTTTGLLDAAASLAAYGNKDLDLGDLLSVLEPGLGRITLVLAEFALVGSLLQVVQARDRVAASAASSCADMVAESDVRRRSKRQMTTGAALSVANLGVVACCLAGSRPEAILASTSVPWGSPDDPDVSWPASLGYLSLLGRSVLSIMALAGALVDMQDRVSVRLSWILGVADLAPDGLPS